LFVPDDTIVAVATPPGRGGIGVVRLSGPAARRVAQSMLDRADDLEPRRATHALVRARTGAERAGEHLDEVIATFFPGPASYTGEDVVEIGAHGSPVVLRAILREAMAAGARLAEPGEFTLRAFLHGRIDLVQAEAVADLVDAVTPQQARVAFDQLQGTLTRAVHAIDAELFDLSALLEASVDFPEEGYHFLAPGEAGRRLGEATGRLRALLGDARRGRAIREGLQVVILGKPNTGKSSVFNMLVGSERAIVTSVPGTTRDLVSETANVDGLALRVVDTAGLRATTDLIENEGVTRAVRAATVADVVLVVLDQSRPLDDEDRAVLARTRGADQLVVVNKVDLPASWAESEWCEVGRDPIRVSMTAGIGLSELREALVTKAAGTEGLQEPPAVSNIRHIELLERSLRALERAGEGAAQAGKALPEEFVLEELQEARGALEEICGRRSSDELLQHIFSRFCVGK
jgi:tRNA modification GTPase